MRNRYPFVLDRTLLLGCECGLGGRIRTTMDANLETTFGDPRSNVEVDREGGTADLLEPESVLLDEVERQPIRARRTRRAHCELDLDPFPGGNGVRQWRSGPVPDDRIAKRVEPVKRRLNAVLSMRAPCCRAGVLERDARHVGHARARRLERPREPAGRKRPCSDGMLTDTIHAGYSR